MSLKPLKKALVLKVPRTHSCTEMSCSETTANLESDEIVEPETEAISKEISEAPSLGNNNGVLRSNHLPTTEDNTKNINELTKLVENSNKLIEDRFNTILKTISLQNSQSINTPARSVVSSVNCFNSHINLTDSRSASIYMLTKTTAANNPTFL